MQTLLKPLKPADVPLTEEASEQSAGMGQRGTPRDRSSWRSMSSLHGAGGSAQAGMRAEAEGTAGVHQGPREGHSLARPWHACGSRKGGRARLTAKFLCRC